MTWNSGGMLLHGHDHPAPELPDVDGRRFGVDQSASMAPAAALVGAVRDRCGECTDALRRRMATGPRLALAELVGSVLGVLASLPDVSRHTHQVWLVARRAAAERDGAPLYRLVATLDPDEVDAVLVDLVRLMSQIRPAGHERDDVDEDLADVDPEECALCDAPPDHCDHFN